MHRFALLLILFFLQDDPYAQFKAGKGDPRVLLAKALETEAASGLKSLDPTHLLRAAELARPYCEPYTRQLARIVLTLNAKAKGCDACSGGMAKCPGCENGFVAQTCRTCDGKGSTSCPLCFNKTGMSHESYRGRMRFVLANDVKVKTKSGEVTLYAQTLVWELGACNGGQVAIKSISTPKNPKHPDKTEKNTVSCGEIFEQFEQFIYKGKAKVWLGDDPSKSKALTLDGAMRIFVDFKKCKDGIIPCTQCSGTKTRPCVGCNAKGTRQVVCPSCGGAKTLLCEKCLLVGDASWVAKQVPPKDVAELTKILTQHGYDVAVWDRTRIAKADATAKLETMKKGLDPAAKLTADMLALPCPTCKGSGGSCGDCWGTGRREYAEGTAEYDRYSAVRVIELKIALAPSVPVLKIDLAKPAPVVEAPPPIRPADTPGVGSGVGGTIGKLPADVQDLLDKAQKQHDAAKESLAKSKATKDPDEWASEAKKAVDGFRAAQRFLTAVQETLDERGIDVPLEVLDRVRNNMQALVMARKQTP